MGGFATFPLVYRPLRQRLLQRGASRVDIAPIWTPSWLLAAIIGLGPLMRVCGKAIVRARGAADGRPIMVIGHSAGGIVARLAMSREPFEGRVASVAEAVGALVTLGTPHDLGIVDRRHHHAGHRAARFLADTNPGAFFAPRTGYLTVGSRAIPGGPPGHPHPMRRLTGLLYGSLFRSESGGSLGDGLVPCAGSHLEGARQITYPDVLHGHIGS
ncbi:MAG: hypothetical protein H0V12_03315, partial [Chloroflexi bacterium]|nr:hypothetical protein [Chloroflexota bacterium]